MTANASEARISPVLLQCGREGWRRFSKPVGTVQAHRLDDVRGALEEVESVTRRGLYAAGFITYEAAPAFDPAFVTLPAGALPLVWFGIYRECERTALAELPRPSELDGRAQLEPLDWRPTIDRTAYGAAVDRIRRRIAGGDTYQVNFTWRLTARFDRDAYAYFLQLARGNPGRYAAFVDTGAHAICSFSPELFFRLENDSLTCRPMKGTSRRGLYRAQDDRLQRELRSSIKNRAENVMIVDMVRNDLGRIARPGSVRAPELFEIEPFPTVLQMTSTVEARTDAAPCAIMAALFPCASITGAPKVETMKIIAGLENEPREVYTGAIGYFGPGRRALFGVAIRTVQVDRGANQAVYGTGGGIVWDSDPGTEFAEGQTKTLLLTSAPSDYSLLETLRWDDAGFHLLERHLERLEDSADLLGFAFDEAEVRAKFARLAGELAEAGSGRRYRVRLRLDRDGSITSEHFPLGAERSIWRIELARQPIDPAERFYYHKTTERSAYDAFRSQAPDADDVLLWNPKRELTETTLANVAVRLGGSWYTPPIECGLLAGTQRAEYLAQGRLRERVLTLEDLAGADALAIVNSVRGWLPARLVADRSGRLRAPAPLA